VSYQSSEITGNIDNCIRVRNDVSLYMYANALTLVLK